MDVVQFNPIIQPKMVTDQFCFTLDRLKYAFDASSGKVECSGPWNPDYCFPRHFLYFQGYLFSVNILFHGGKVPGAVRSILIPSSVEIIDSHCFGSNFLEFLPCRSLELVVFEPHSQLTDLRDGAFMDCSSLQCFYLPRSVERISDLCFCRCLKFSHFGFECGSRLNFIGDQAFVLCGELKWIVIPASVSHISERAFRSSGIQNASNISIEAGNENLIISGDCMVDLNGVRLVTYFCSNSRNVLSRDIEIIGSHFCHDRNLVDVNFEPGSKLSRILDCAFLECRSLRSILIPTSVTIISGSAFATCNLKAA
jgi:hypothetical protein